MSKKIYHNGDHQLIINAEQEKTVTLVFEASSSGSLFIELQGEGKLCLDYQFEKHSDWNLLTLNESSKSLVIEESIYLYKDASLSMNYGELSYGSHTRNTTANFLGENSEMELNAAILSFDSLDWNILAHHLAKKSVANVNNQAIVLKDAHLNLDIIGKIDNGF